MYILQTTFLLKKEACSPSFPFISFTAFPKALAIIVSFIRVLYWVFFLLDSYFRQPLSLSSCDLYCFVCVSFLVHIVVSHFMTPFHHSSDSHFPYLSVLFRFNFGYATTFLRPRLFLLFLSCHLEFIHCEIFFFQHDLIC